MSGEVTTILLHVVSVAGYLALGAATARYVVRRKDRDDRSSGFRYLTLVSQRRPINSYDIHRAFDAGMKDERDRLSEEMLSNHHAPETCNDRPSNE